MSIGLEGFGILLVTVDDSGQLTVQATHLAYGPLALLLAGRDLERNLLARVDLQRYLRHWNISSIN